MLPGVQLIGIVFALAMLYLTFLYYKRNEYGLHDFIIWICVWVMAIFIVSFPTTIYGVMEALEIKRTADFFALAGFMFFSVVIFYLYVTTKKTKRRMEEVVRRIAIQQVELPKRK
ncbi:DUF2304 domain-containing protein [Candidatus Woesearchaeota archaeon]|nr:DUF2304 domain-containing protein [Candidatus Woesearchaeota archaeon]